MAKQQVLHPSRRGTTLASLGFAALVAALLGMAWTISTRMYAPIPSPTTSVSAPVADEVPAGALAANRYFADEIAGANAQYADAAALTEALPERLQDVRRPVVSVAAPAAPQNQARTSNRFFADEIAGANAQARRDRMINRFIPDELLNDVVDPTMFVPETPYGPALYGPR
jgi:hypothetical protein